MPAERSEDGRHVLVDGRRWRATDPRLPPGARDELVGELMAARRAVGAAGGDPDAERAARDRVQHAKVALGERGPVWWEPVTGDELAARRRATVLALARRRGVLPGDPDVVVTADRCVAHLVVEDVAEPAVEG